MIITFCHLSVTLFYHFLSSPFRISFYQSPRQPPTQQNFRPGKNLNKFQVTDSLAEISMNADVEHDVVVVHSARIPLVHISVLADQDLNVS